MDTKILEWLKARNITLEVLENAGVKWNGKKIVIPVRDLTGKFIFNKFRKNPFAVGSDEPKYTYEKGATAALYNAHNVQPNKPVFIVEGELDALLLQSCGLNAVSSTGGSGSFKQEWASFLLDKTNEIYICYDRDMAGFKGAVRVQQLIPVAKIVTLPFTLQGKDVTDYMGQFNMAHFQKIVREAESWVMPKEPELIPDTQKGIKDVIKMFTEAIGEFDERRCVADQKFQPTEHIEIIIEALEKKVEVWKNMLKNLGRYNNKEEKRDVVLKAKQYPITNLIKLNHAGFASCVFHTENTPSMKYYRQSNVVHCYSCQKHADAIDVYMALKRVDFQTAIKEMTS